MPRKKTTDVKVPEPRQLPSGNWFIQLQTIDPVTGKRTSKSITDPDPKACKARAIAIKSGVVEEKKKKTIPTLGTVIDKYIAAKSNVLSKSTLPAYKSYRKHRLQSYMDKPIDKIKWQQMINAEAADISPKTVMNVWSLVHAAVEYETGEDIKVTLPQRPKHEKVFLTAENVPVFVSAIKDKEIAIPALLGLHSLRMSEIKGLRWKDIDLKKKLIYVRGAMVYAGEKTMVYKETNKNTSSARTIPILIPELEALLKAADKSTEYVTNATEMQIYKGVNKVCKENKLPQIGVHGLRHSFASLCYHLNVPMRVTMKLGGWNTERTVSEVYTHLSDQDIANEASKLTAFFAKKK